MIRTGVLLCILVPSMAVGEDSYVRLENDSLLVEFSRVDGSITRLRNKVKNLDLVASVSDSPRPWALLLAPFQIVADFTQFHITASPDTVTHNVTLQWETPYDITVKAEAQLAPGSDQLVLKCAAENTGNHTILALRYPAIQGIGPLGEVATHDRLLHSTAMGCLFHDPFHLFQAGSADPLAAGLVVSRYPNGFHGSALQLMAYYTEGQGGFYIATQDSSCSDKDLNFFKSSPESLTCEIAHMQSDARPGKSLAVDYPIAIAALTEGTWYEAAERYREWAVKQPWCQRGTRHARMNKGDACQWLLEDIGAVGMWWPFRSDLRDTIVRTRELYGAPLLHLELWWSNEGSRQAAQSEGDRFGPFYFPFLALRQESVFAGHGRDQIVPPAMPISPDWIAMCPVQPAWRQIFCESAEDMVGLQPQRHHQIWVDENRTGCQADCLYYDIGPCAGIPTHCYAADHEHNPGAGREITQSHRSLLGESQRRASAVKGQYVPIGTECVSEPFVDCLDLYYARNAGFAPDMEVANYVRRLTWLPDGQMETIPLFPFIYHEYGPMAVQGIYPIPPWNTAEGDPYFAWAEARAVLWGGLITTFPRTAGDAVSDQRTRWLRNLVAARTVFAKDFLAYGRLQRPPAIVCDSIDIDHGLAEGGWLRTIRFSQDTAELQRALSIPDEGQKDQTDSEGITVEQWAKSMLALPATPAKSSTMRVPAVVGQAYTRGDSRLGILLVNLPSNADSEIQLEVDPVACGLPPSTYSLKRITADGERRLNDVHDRSKITLQLSPGEVALLEAVRQDRL